MELDLHATQTTEDALTQLEDELDLLRKESQLLERFLRRVQPDVLHQAPPKLRQGLLIGEKNEICGQEVEQCSLDIERCAAGADAQQAHLAAAVAECRLQVAEVGRDAHDLLKLLALQPPDAAPQAASSNSNHSEQSAGTAPAAAEVPLVLPSARQLAQVVIGGDKVERFLEDCLRRQDVSIERLQMRGGILKVQLAKLEQSLAAKLDMGGSLQQVDYEQLKIQHAQALATLDKHSTQAVGLKLDVGAAVQVLADIRSSLASTTADSAVVQQQTALTDRQLDAVQASLAAVQGECSALENECSALKQQKEQWGDTGGGAQILDYIKLKTAVQEAQKGIADYRRKIEVASAGLKA